MLADNVVVSIPTLILNEIFSNMPFQNGNVALIKSYRS